MKLRDVILTSTLGLIVASWSSYDGTLTSQRYSGAFTQVVDALDARSAAAEIHGARTAQSAALQTALRLAQRRYDEGYADYLGVLDARRSLLQSRLAVAEARRSGGAAYVDLVLAVGGGWGPGPQLERLERNL